MGRDTMSNQYEYKAVCAAEGDLQDVLNKHATNGFRFVNTATMPGSEGRWMVIFEKATTSSNINL